MPAKKTAPSKAAAPRRASMKIPAALAGAARRRAARRAAEAPPEPPPAARRRAAAAPKAPVKRKERINWSKVVTNPTRTEAKKVLDKGVSKADQLMESAMKWIVKLAIRAKALYDMLEAWWTGKFDMPVGTLQAIMVALLYFLSPLDIIPDVLPFFGLADDAAVFAFVVHKIKKDLEAFAAASGKTVEDLGL